MSYEKMLSPGRIGTLETKNRIVFPPMGTTYAKERQVTDRTIQYHVRRVKGGCGLNIVESGTVHPTACYLDRELGLYEDRFIPGLKTLTDAIHDAGGKAAIQLIHEGRQAAGSDENHTPWAPSAIPCEVTKVMPHVMTVDEIKEIVSSFGDAALRAKKAGFDAVEIHGAHGYLLDCFLNECSNTRTDEYGGSFENRIRFALEVIRDVRAKVGKDFPVLIRMNAVEGVEGGITIEDGVRAAKLYEEAGVDALDVSQGNYSVQYVTTPPFFYPHKINVPNAARIKAAVSIPVIVAGRITTPEMAEEVLQEGSADFISIGRGQICDPDFVKKATEGRSDEIMRCIGCMQGCIGRGWIGLTTSCMFNPQTGYEAERKIIPTEEPKNVLVIGGGPGGLEAAKIAAIRGHKVTLFEKTALLGGRFLIAGRPPHKRDIISAVNHMGYLARKAGVDIRVYTEATEENIKKVNPDVIIIATGATPIVPNIPGVDTAKVYLADDVVEGRCFVSEDNIVVIGGGLVGLETAEILSCEGKKVSIVEMSDEIGRDLVAFVRPYFEDFIRDHEIACYTESKCVEIEKNHIVIEKDGKTMHVSGDAVVLAVGGRSNRQIEETVKALGIPYHFVGDASAQGKAIDAIWHGNEVARQL